MSDLIDRDEAIKAFEEYVGLNKNSCDAHHMILSILRSLPSQVICCRDCKYSHITASGECKYCDIWFPDEKTYVSGDFFCAYGERRENNE